MAGALRSCGGPTEKLVRPGPFQRLGSQYAQGRELQVQPGPLLDACPKPGTCRLAWVTPDGFPDTKPAWLGSTPLIMTWRLLNMLFLDWAPDDLANPNGNWHEYFSDRCNRDHQDRTGANERTANKIVNFWVNRLLGYDAASPATPQLDAAVRAAWWLSCSRMPPALDTVLDLDPTVGADQAWQAYVPQRLQTLVASIAMLPDNLLR